MRLFFAVELPSQVQAVLGRLDPRDEGRDYRWTDPALLHVTLAFLGQQPAEQLDVLTVVGARAAAVSRAGVLKLGEPGSFGARSAPRVLWIGLDGDVAALQALHATLNSGLRKIGFELEDRPFRPHVTLARRRDSARGGPPRNWPPIHRLSPNDGFPMRALTLFESRLSPRGPSYLHLADFPLSVDAGDDEPYSAANRQRR